MARIDAKQLDDLLGVMKRHGVATFDGLGMKVTFETAVGKVSVVDPDFPGVNLTKEEQRKLDHQEAMVNEDWSSQG